MGRPSSSLTSHDKVLRGAGTGGSRAGDPVRATGRVGGTGGGAPRLKPACGTAGGGPLD